MKLVREFLKAQSANDRIAKVFAELTAAPDEELRDRYFECRQNLGAAAVALADCDYSEDPSSDYQTLMRNAYFRETIAILATDYNIRQRMTLRLDSSKQADFIKRERDSIANQERIKLESFGRDIGIEQVSCDNTVRATLLQSDPDLMSAIDHSVAADIHKPSIHGIKTEDEIELVVKFLAIPEIRETLSLSDRFFLFLSPKSFATQLVENNQAGRENAKVDLLDKLRTKRPSL